MIAAVIGVHVTVCITLVILILLQQGKGADVGAVFGGSSNTVFGASGAGNLMTRATSALAVTVLRDLDILGVCVVAARLGHHFRRADLRA